MALVPVQNKLAITKSSVQNWEGFFETYYDDDIKELARNYPDKRSLNVKFSDIENRDFDLARELLEHPDSVLKHANEALATFGFHIDVDFINTHVRVVALPERIQIRELRSSHINKFIAVAGLIRKATEVRPKIINAAFKCQRCEHVTMMPQGEGKFVEPFECENDVCGRKGPFKLVHEESEFIDAQKLRVQESPDDLRGGEQPQTLDVDVDDDLAGIVAPGDRVVVSGILRSYQRSTQQGKSTFFDLVLDGVSIEIEDKEFEDIEISKEEIENILALGKDPEVYKKVIYSIAPSIYGYEEVKEAMALQLFSGIAKSLPDGTRIRGDVHILLVGDPGVAKSQLLRYGVRLAPRGIYTSGKSSTSAGLTATAVKDEFGDGRWTLEAGALVLADMGLACVDELDKMEADDRSSMHEAMEQQSYHPKTEIMFANGEKEEIGKFVDELIISSREKVINGNNCEILNLSGNKTFKILTTDFKNIYPTVIDRVSRHKAPKYFIKITYSNGRSVTVTPEHPIYILKDGEIKETRADSAKKGMLAPVAGKYPIEENKVSLLRVEMRPQTKKIISFPTKIDNDLARLLGYIVSEGHFSQRPKNRSAEIMISNTDEEIINDACKIIKALFDIEPYVQIQATENRRTATKDLYNVRCVSVSLGEFFKSNFPEVLAKSNEKRIPKSLFHASEENRAQFLLGAFRGDGFYDSERFGYVTNSINLARDYSDLLLSLSIYSYITQSALYFSNRDGKLKPAYKVVISGSESAQIFYGLIGRYDKRNNRINQLVQRSKNRLNDNDRVPWETCASIKKLLRDYRLDDGYFCHSTSMKTRVHRKIVLKYLDKVEHYVSTLNGTSAVYDVREIRQKYKIPITEVASRIRKSGSMVTYIERTHSKKNYITLQESVVQLAKEKLENTETSIKKLKSLIASDIRFIQIKTVEILNNENVEWVYDVTVEPNHTFISEGLVLHNTISIAKAGIMATLKSRCALLGAANPKFGRFDRYEPIAKQINMPPALLSRFDLIFILTDEPSVSRDTAIAEHILKAHYAGELSVRRANVLGSGIEIDEITRAMEVIQPVIQADMLRKYIAYTKRSIFPIIRDEARKQLIDFYLGLRKQGEDPNSPVPVTARQLEALIRLAEASARVRLSNEITTEDTARVIRIVMASLKQVMTDPETGKLDSDIINVGMGKSQRVKAKTLREIIRELQDEYKGAAPLEDIISRAEESGIKKDTVEDMIQKLKSAGEIIEASNGRFRVV
ncbi:MAG: MCM family protein [Candidatus Methanoperedens sp.]|nr:MCM family protein [Candidatus Methanoperedens sp.]